MNNESAGARLKKIRLEKGLSLEEVQKKTKIHLNVLKAIEEDNLANVSPIYIKGFLKMYCQSLGVDPREYILGYREPERTVRLLAEREAKAVAYPKIKGFKWNFLLRYIKPKIAIVFALACALAVVLYYAGRFIASRHRPVANTPAEFLLEKSIAEKKQDAAKRNKVNLPAASASANKFTENNTQYSKSAFGVRLILRAKEDCFIQRLKTDGRVVFNGVLKKGRFEVWQAKDKIEFSLSNAGAVELEVNGKPIYSLGRKGEARKNIVITKEGLSAP